MKSLPSARPIVFYRTIRNIVTVHYTYALVWNVRHPDEPMLVGVRAPELVRSALGAVRSAYNGADPADIPGKSPVPARPAPLGMKSGRDATLAVFAFQGRLPLCCDR